MGLPGWVLAWVLASNILEVANALLFWRRLEMIKYSNMIFTMPVDVTWTKPSWWKFHGSSSVYHLAVSGGPQPLSSDPNTLSVGLLGWHNRLGKRQY
jgi:hypothetical protein